MHNETRNYKKLKVHNLALFWSMSSSLIIVHYRRSTTLQMIFVQPYLILASWVSSKNVVVKCGWVNVCKWSQHEIWEINDAQDNGIVLARISSSHFEITMRLARLNVFKSWSILSWPTCLQVAKSTPLTARRQNRRFSGFLEELRILMYTLQIQKWFTDQSNDRSCRCISTSWSSSSRKDTTRCSRPFPS